MYAGSFRERKVPDDWWADALFIPNDASKEQIEAAYNNLATGINIIDRQWLNKAKAAAFKARGFE